MCCEHCKPLQNKVEDLEENVANLKRKLRSLVHKNTKIEEKMSNDSCDNLEKSCRELVVNSTSVFSTVNSLMRKLFTEEEILSHSVSGKAANSKIAAKPKFDSAKLDLVKKITIDVHGKEIVNTITDKIQAVIKAVKREKQKD